MILFLLLFISRKRILFNGGFVYIQSSPFIMTTPYYPMTSVQNENRNLRVDHIDIWPKMNFVGRVKTSSGRPKANWTGVGRLVRCSMMKTFPNGRPTTKFLPRSQTTFIQWTSVTKKCIREYNWEKCIIASFLSKGEVKRASREKKNGRPLCNCLV